MHLTETAYGDIAEYLLDTVSGRAVVDAAGPPRKRLESILTRSASDPLQKPMPMAGLSAATRAVHARGRGNMRGQPGSSGRGTRGKAAQWRGRSRGRWAPY